MPIELRPSDVWAKLSESFGTWQNVFQNIATKESERERVKVVHEKLITQEELWQKSLDENPTRGFEVPREAPEEGVGVNPQALSPVVKTLGQMTQGEIENDLKAQTDQLRESIMTTPMSKAARAEALRNLDEGALNQRGRVLGQWRGAAQANGLSIRDNLTYTTLKDKTLTPEVQIDRIRGTVTEMTVAGFMRPDEAQKYMQEVEYKARYNSVLTGAMALATTTEREVKETVTPRKMREGPVQMEGGPQTEEELAPYEVTKKVPITIEQAIQEAMDSIEKSDYFAADPETKLKLQDEVLVQAQRQYAEVNRQNVAFDYTVETDISKVYGRDLNSVEGLQTLLTQVQGQEFRVPGHREEWIDRLERRLAIITKDPAGTATADTQWSSDFGKWYASARNSSIDGKPTSVPIPGIGPAGTVVTKANLAKWLIVNMGADDAGNPRIPISYAVEQSDAIRNEVTGANTDAKQMLERFMAADLTATKPLHDAKYWQSRQSDLDNFIREGGKSAQKVTDFMWTLITGSVIGAAPEEAGGEGRKTDNVDQFLLDVKAGNWKGWQSLSNYAELLVARDKLAQILALRFSERMGIPPEAAKAAVGQPTPNGEVVFIYQPPNDPDKTHPLFRFEPNVNPKKPPVLMRYTGKGTTGGWEALTEQRVVTKVEQDVLDLTEQIARSVKVIAKWEADSLDWKNYDASARAVMKSNAIDAKLELERFKLDLEAAKKRFAGEVIPAEYAK